MVIFVLLQEQNIAFATFVQANVFSRQNLEQYKSLSAWISWIQFPTPSRTGK